MANTISVSVLADVKDMKRGVDQVNAQLTGLGKSASKAGSLIKAGLAIAGAKAVTDFVGGAIKDAEDAAATTKVLTQTFEQMGGASSKAFQEAVDFSGELSKAIAVDDGDIQKVQTKLSTFGNVWNDPIKGAENFKRATGLAFDLAAAGFGSADGNAVQLGKALNDPIKGMSALAKSGVTFTAAEKEKIKKLQESGDLLGAQEILYKAIEGQVGGAAKANVTGSKKMAVALGEVKESIGTALLPAFQALTDFVLTTVVPMLESTIAFVTENKDTFIALATGIGVLVAAYYTYIGVTKVISAATKAWTIIQAALNIVMSLNPIGLVVIAIAALVAAVIIAWKNSETFRKIVTAAWEAIKTAAVAVFNFIKTVITTVFNFIKGYFTTVFNIYKTIFSTAWNAIKTVVSTVWEGIKTAVSKGIENITGFFSGLKDKLLGILSGAKDWLLDAGSNIISGLLKGITDKFEDVKDFIGGIGSWIADHKGPKRYDLGLLVNNGRWIMDGLDKGLRKGYGTVQDTVQGLAPAIQKDFGSPALAMAGGGGRAAGNTYTINVTAVDPKAASRAVVDAIKEYERSNGTGWRK